MLFNSFSCPSILSDYGQGNINRINSEKKYKYKIDGFDTHQQVSRRFEDGEQFLSIGNGNRVSVLTIGVLNLVFDSCIVELVDYHYCLSFIMSIISIGLLASCGYELLKNKDVC